MKNSKEQITKLFVDFLINKDMSINMTLKGVDLSALENVGNAFKIVNKHIDNCKPQFETIFNDVHDLRQNSHFQKQLNDQNRICVMASPISLSKGWAEVLYGISLDGRLFSHIYFANKNELFDVFLEEIKSQSNLEIAEFDHGATIFKGKNMGDFLNDENSEKKIEDWFCNSFRELSEFMKNSSDNIEWNIKTLPENA